MATVAAGNWSADSELTGFVAKTLTCVPDYDGPVTATLVRKASLTSRPKGAILYIHGFIDYFFQRHVADWFYGDDYNFYGLDLRKYGRSLGKAKHPNICLDFHEYFEEITAAIDIIVGEGHRSVTLIAHSTGALPAALYAKEGLRASAITSLIFNSPFLALPYDAPEWLLLWLGQIRPCGATDNRVNKWYVRSLHCSEKGVWDFNLKLKPLKGFDAYFGWLRAVVVVQKRIREGLGLTQPVLVMRSDKSLKGSRWIDEFHRADLVLDVEDIKRIAPAIGAGVVPEVIPGGKHDLTLSEDTPRERCLRLMLDWVRTHS